MELQLRSLSEARDPLVGRVIHDRYRVLKRIGKGGMGIVYLAEHVLIGRKMAIKTLSERAFASEEMLARFQREAMAAAAVGDDHVIDVTDMGRLEDGTCYIVMEYLEGIDVAGAVASQGCFPVERAVDVIGQLCDALTAVHRAGIVHRDLKPENLFLIDSARGRDFVKVLDFGICKLADERSLTGTGASLGTPQFMAPEQFESSARVDARADLYAAGAILYYLLTGLEPFEGDTLQQIFMRVSSQPAPRVGERRSDVPATLDEVVQRALQKRPEERFADAAELKSALLAAVAGTRSTSGVVPRAPRDESQRSAALPTSEGPLPAPPLLRTPRRLALSALVLVCGGLALWQLTAPREPQRPVEPAASATQPARPSSADRRHRQPSFTPASAHPSGQAAATSIASELAVSATAPPRRDPSPPARPRVKARGVVSSRKRSSMSESPKLSPEHDPVAAGEPHASAPQPPTTTTTPSPAVAAEPPAGAPMAVTGSAEPAVTGAAEPERAQHGYELPRRTLKRVFEEPEPIEPLR